MTYPLTPGHYLLPTPAGAFSAIAGRAEHRLGRFMAALLLNGAQDLLTEDKLCAWSGFDHPEEALAFLGRTHELGWVQALVHPFELSVLPLEQLLPTLLPHLSIDGKILIADTQGFYLHSHGFPHEVAEELSALSADLASLHQRRSGSLNRNLGLSGSAWALTNAAGHSQLGFWPIHVGKERFVLVIAGQPAFNRPQLVELVVHLHRRFATPTTDQSTILSRSEDHAR